jgi:hypothetical protein
MKRAVHSHKIVPSGVSGRELLLSMKGSRGGIWGLRRVEKFCSSCYGEFDRCQLKINIRVAQQCRGYS